MKRVLSAVGFLVAALVSVPAFAQFTPIPTPTADYTSGTTLMAIPGANLSTTTTLTSGTETLTFGSTVSVRTVPGGGWATWNSPPAVESSTPKVLAITTGLTSMTITLSEPHTTFGFELEPNNGTQSMTVTFMNGATSLGSVTRTVVGTSGALLFAGSTTTPITSVVLTAPAGAGGFAMAQFRFGDPSPVPAMGPMALAALALMLLVAGTLLVRRRGLAS
jgi:hypothetical protein